MLQETIPEAISQIHNSPKISPIQLNHLAVQKILNWCKNATKDVNQTMCGLQEYFNSLFNQIDLLKGQFNKLRPALDVIKSIFMETQEQEKLCGDYSQNYSPGR